MSQEALYFSGDNKVARELATCGALLRYLGVQFQEEELKPSSEEPCDVGFREARFQVTEVLDKDRKRHKEYKDRDLGKRASEPSSHWMPGPMSWAEVVDILIDHISTTRKILYDRGAKANTDLAVYFNHQGTCPDPATEPAGVVRLAAMGWRSVSVVHNAGARVLLAQESAPEFLRSAVGRTFTMADLAKEHVGDPFRLSEWIRAGKSTNPERT